MGRRKKWVSVDWQPATDVQKQVLHLVRQLNLDWIDTKNLHFMRSNNSSSRAYARIWGLSKVWQMALGTKPAYIIEVLAQHFDKLSQKEKDKVLLHEIAHIPKNFSGSLLAHTRVRGKRNFHDRVEELFSNYLKTRK